jgi:ADP-heptose:LPS heptosyltransferase
MRRAIVRWLGRPTRKIGARTFAVAISKVDKIGDFVLAKGAIDQVVRRYDESRVLFVVSTATAELIRGWYPAAQVETVPAFLGHRRALFAARDVRRRLGRIKAERCIALRHLRNDFDDLILTWLASDCVRIEPPVHYPYLPGKRWYRSPIPGGFFPEGTGLDTAQAFGTGSPVELRWHREVLSRFIGDVVPQDAVLPRIPSNGSERLVAVCPFGSEPIRDVSFSILVTVLRELRRSFSAPFKLIGSSQQSDKLNLLARKLGAIGIDAGVESNLTTLEFVATIADAAFVISAESAAAHIAAAADRRALIFIGGGHLGHFGPWSRSNRQVWITNRVGCAGCNWRCRYSQPICLTEINESAAVDAVVRAVRA